MSYDPTHPVNGDIADADQLREKLDHTHGRIDEAHARIDNIPAGPQGPAGPPGPQGDPGPQGPPGEVTSAHLSDAIAGTARNPSAIAPFPGTFSDPPTQAEMIAYAAWAETLRAALVR